MILIGLGANLPSPRFGPPLATCRAALQALDAEGLRVVARSRWYRGAPVPLSDQPWFVNGVASVETTLPPAAVLSALHRIEDAFGRVRGKVNAPRTLDLDLLDYEGLVSADDGKGPVLPHPRLSGRAFVLLPLRDIVPGWRHPESGESLTDLIARLPVDQVTEPVDEKA